MLLMMLLMAEDIEFSLKILYCLRDYFEYQTYECIVVLKAHIPLKTLQKYELFKREETCSFIRHFYQCQKE